MSRASPSQPIMATPGPWSISEVRSVEGEYLVVAGEGHSFGLVASCPEKADALAIAALPALVKALEDARQSLALADKMISEHIEEYHDFDYEPHQVPPELASLRAMEHHLMGSLILDEEIAALSHRSAKT